MINKIDGLTFIPINSKKIPLVEEWQIPDREYDFSKASGVGLLCANGVTGIDFDLKYDITGTLFDRFKKAVSQIDKELLKKMVVQKTTNGGYHLIFKCSVIEGNKKLAQRYATEEEKLKGDKVKVLIETRGEGGYLAVEPTQGYKFIYGSLDKIQEITPDEREILISTARTFNEVFKEVSVPRVAIKKEIKGLTPFEDYNNQADVVALLEKHGWSVMGQKGSKTLLKRPGQTSSAHSGNYDHDKNWFSVFSTSTEFEPETPYLPYAVYAYLECNKDFSEASRRLYEEGFGDRIENNRENDIKIPTRINELDDDFSFVITDEDTEEYLHKVRSGTLSKGKSTGIPELDKHFLFKDNTLVVLNGLDNVGKTSSMIYLAVLSAVFSDWKWILYSSENGHGYVKRRLMEFYWSKPLSALNETEYDMAKKFVAKHFTIIKSDDELYNYKDLLVMANKLLKKQKYNAFLIDPYNSLKIDMPKGYKLSVHDYHYEAISEIQLWTKHNCSVYINTHPYTDAGRNLIEVECDDGSKVKLTAPPRKPDVEGGSKFSNKADDFITIHRYTDHPSEWMFTQLHIRKVKEVETGGKVTPVNAPIMLRMIPNQCGFETESGINVILAHHGKTGTQYPMSNNDKWEEETKIY